MNEEEFYISEKDITVSMKIVRFYFQRLSWLTPNNASKLFWKLFTNPRKRELNTNHLHFLEKANSTNHITPQFNAPFTVHRFGNGNKKILICHGWEGRTVDFKNLIELLLQDHQTEIISIDFPGHGTSPKYEAHLPIFVDAIIQVLKEEPDIQTLIGHSLGAASIAVSVSELNTIIERKNLILMGLHPVPSQFFYQYKQVTRINERVFRKCLRYAEQKVGRSLMDLDCHNYIEEFNQNKILFVHDTEDKIIHLKRILDFSEKIKGAKVYHSKGGGHFKHFKNNDVLDAIFQFINEE